MTKNLNKLFAYFLSEKKIPKNFKATSYGYRTYDNSWKLLKDKLQIVHHQNVKYFENGEYTNKLEEIVFKITQVPGLLKVDFVEKKLY